MALTISVSVYAQKKTKDKVLTEICDCFEQDDRDVSNYDEYLDLMVRCASMPIINNSDALAKELGIDKNSPNVYEQVGEKMGAELVLNCPKAMEVTLNVLSEDDVFSTEVIESIGEDYDFSDYYDPESYTDDYEDDYEEYDFLTASGKVTNVTGDFPTIITLQTEEGESLQFYWIDAIGEDDEYTVNPSLFIGKQIGLTYELKGLYFASKKEYQDRKVIYLLDFVE